MEILNASLTLVLIKSSALPLTHRLESLVVMGLA